MTKVKFLFDYDGTLTAMQNVHDLFRKTWENGHDVAIVSHHPSGNQIKRDLGLSEAELEKIPIDYGMTSYHFHELLLDSVLSRRGKLYNFVYGSVASAHSYVFGKEHHIRRVSDQDDIVILIDDNPRNVHLALRNHHLGILYKTGSTTNDEILNLSNAFAIKNYIHVNGKDLTQESLRTYVYEAFFIKYPELEQHRRITHYNITQGFTNQQPSMGR